MTLPLSLSLSLSLFFFFLFYFFFFFAFFSSFSNFSDGTLAKFDSEKGHVYTRHHTFNPLER
jgi:hypothetical protein